MQKIAIVDIGSNTIVLNIYEKENAALSLIQSFSSPVGLVRYIHDHHMCKDGILAAMNVLQTYQDKIHEQHIDKVFAFITEPARHLDNQMELLSAFQKSGFIVDPLSGEEEAHYDYLGSRIDCGDIASGVAFDVGGGSTELIAFHQGKIIEAISFPLGCVRLQTLPITDVTVDLPVQQVQKEHPLLTSIPSSTLIGIGGTCRAAGQLLNQPHSMDAQELFLWRDRLKQKDPDSMAKMQAVITPSRRDVFLPGLNMICAILKAYDAKAVRISSGGVREGYLLSHTENI